MINYEIQELHPTGGVSNQFSVPEDKIDEVLKFMVKAIKNDEIFGVRIKKSDTEN